MTQMKRILKYGTGEEVPPEAVYLTTLVEIIEENRFVWHYFLVEKVKHETNIK
jgi:hypothetical protein